MAFMVAPWLQSLLSEIGFELLWSGRLLEALVAAVLSWDDLGVLDGRIDIRGFPCRRGFVHLMALESKEKVKIRREHDVMPRCALM